MSKFVVIKLIGPNHSHKKPRTWYIVYDKKGAVIETYQLKTPHGAHCITNQNHLTAWYDAPISFNVSCKELKRVADLKIIRSN